MTASAIIIHIYTKLQISCYENFIFLFLARTMINDAHLLRFYGGHCWIRWSNGPLSDLNRSNQWRLVGFEIEEAHLVWGSLPINITNVFA